MQAGREVRGVGVGIVQAIEAPHTVFFVPISAVHVDRNIRCRRHLSTAERVHQRPWHILWPGLDCPRTEWTQKHAGLRETPAPPPFCAQSQLPASMRTSSSKMHCCSAGVRTRAGTKARRGHLFGNCCVNKVAVFQAVRA